MPDVHFRLFWSYPATVLEECNQFIAFIYNLIAPTFSPFHCVFLFDCVQMTFLMQLYYSQYSCHLYI